MRDQELSALRLDADDRPSRGGWAPGDYVCECSRCGIAFIGAKRSVTCSDCAYLPLTFEQKVERAIWIAGGYDYTADDLETCVKIKDAVMNVIRGSGPDAVKETGPSTGKEDPHMTTTVKVHVGGQYRATITHPGGQLAVGPDEEKSFHLPHPGGIVEIREDYIGNLSPAPEGPDPNKDSDGAPGGGNAAGTPMGEDQPVNEEDPADDTDPNKPASGSEPA